jgi:imidazolonepropionase-like amidohydrolase
MLLKESVAQNVSFRSWMDKTNLRQNLRKARDYLQKLDEYTRKKDQKKLQELKKPSGIDAYIRLLKKQLPARLSATTATRILGIVELIDEFDISVIIEGAIEAWTVAEQITKHDIRLIITPRDKRRPNEFISAPSGSTLENAAILKKAGVKFAIVPTSPYFQTWGIAGRDLMALPMEAAFAVRGGLDEQTALEAITITAAEILGIANRVGSLQVGKDADIIILDGHPFHHKTFVETTIINGKVLYEKSKSPYFSHIK